MTKIKPNDYVRAAPSQDQPPASTNHPEFKINLSLNESPYPPSPQVVEAFQQSVGTLNRYPNYFSADIRKVLGKKYKLDDTRIMCAAGSEQILAYISRTYIGQGDEVIYPRYGFHIL